MDGCGLKVLPTKSQSSAIAFRRVVAREERKVRLTLAKKRERRVAESAKIPKGLKRRKKLYPIRFFVRVKSGKTHNRCVFNGLVVVTVF